MEKSYPAPTGYSKKEMEGIFSKTKTKNRGFLIPLPFDLTAFFLQFKKNNNNFQI